MPISRWSRLCPSVVESEPAAHSPPSPFIFWVRLRSCLCISPRAQEQCRFLPLLSHRLSWLLPLLTLGTCPHCSLSSSFAAAVSPQPLSCTAPPLLPTYFVQLDGELLHLGFEPVSIGQLQGIAGGTGAAVPSSNGRGHLPLWPKQRDANFLQVALSEGQEDAEVHVLLLEHLQVLQTPNLLQQRGEVLRS